MTQRLLERQRLDNALKQQSPMSNYYSVSSVTILAYYLHAHRPCQFGHPATHTRPSQLGPQDAAEPALHLHLVHLLTGWHAMHCIEISGR